MADFGTCDHCAKRFSYSLIHNGFNESAYAYCDECGCTALLSAWSKRPDDIQIRFHEAIGQNVERHLQSCVCGGHFRFGAAPRCPHCKQPLSAEMAAAYVEANSIGAAKGWRWQGNWIGLYCIVLEGRVCQDPWRDKSALN